MWSVPLWVTSIHCSHHVLHILTLLPRLGLQTRVCSSCGDAPAVLDLGHPFQSAPSPHHGVDDLSASEAWLWHPHTTSPVCGNSLLTLSGIRQSLLTHPMNGCLPPAKSLITHSISLLSGLSRTASWPCPGALHPRRGHTSSFCSGPDGHEAAHLDSFSPHQVATSHLLPQPSMDVFLILLGLVSGSSWGCPPQPAWA